MQGGRHGSTVGAVWCRSKLQWAASGGCSCLGCRSGGGGGRGEGGEGGGAEGREELQGEAAVRGAAQNGGDGQMTPLLRLSAGAVAGIIGMSATYPLDMVRGRLTIQVLPPIRIYPMRGHGTCTLLQSGTKPTPQERHAEELLPCLLEDASRPPPMLLPPLSASRSCGLVHVAGWAACSRVGRLL